MTPKDNSKAAMFFIAASFLIGVAMPLLMAPATKSSPLVIGLSALCALGAVILRDGPVAVKGMFFDAAQPGHARLAAVAVLYMAVSVFWSHNVVSAADQFLQFLVPVVSTAVLLVCFAPSAPLNRIWPWVLTALLAALIIVYDLKTGLKLRELTGGRSYGYSYNRPIVLLVVLFCPLLALVVARRKAYLAVALLPVFFAAASGESETAMLGAAVVAVILPLAWLAPVLVRKAGLVFTLVVLAASPFFGSLAKFALGATLHKALANAHSDDRVNIWLSFEAAAQQKWLFGNGFGSSLNLQNGAVAKLVPPELVTLLGASHPHNAFLQVWVELGLVGAILIAALAVHLFAAVGRMTPLLQPFALACIAAVAGIALVSHGAWQAWWIATIGAAMVGFAAVDHELRNST